MSAGRGGGLGGGVRRPVRGGDVETLDKDILPDNAKEIAKEAPQVKSAQWAADEKKKGKAGAAPAAEVTSLEALSLADVGADDSELRKGKKELKPKMVEEKKVEPKRAQKLEIKRPADELATPLPSAPSTSTSASASASAASESKSSSSSSLNAAAPLREARGLYRPGRGPAKSGNARSSASTRDSKVGLTAAVSPKTDSPSSSSHFDVSQCLHWLSSHLSEQTWEDELAEDSEKRQAFVSDVEKKWNELDLEGRGYFTAEHLVQLYWSQSTGKELDDMPEEKNIDKAIRDKAQKMWKEVGPKVDDEEDDDDDDAEEDEEQLSGDAEEDERAKLKKAAAKAARKRWAKQSVTFWKYVNYLLQKAEYEQLQVTAPPQPWAKAYYPTR